LPLSPFYLLTFGILSTDNPRLNCPIVTIIVGPPGEQTQETFHVHQDALCDRSPFFLNTMKPEWASHRADPRTITLSDDDPAAFSLYVTWLYSGKLPILPEPEEHELPKEYSTLAYAYVLGERLMDNGFKNVIADAYVLYARGAPPAKRAYPRNEEIRIIYEGTAEDAPIRKLLVDIWCRRGKYEWIAQDPDLPPDFLREVVKGLLQVRSSVESLSRPWKTGHEQYHAK
jgi:hypothetical protein